MGRDFHCGKVNEQSQTERLKKSCCGTTRDRYNRQIAVVKSAGKLKFFAKKMEKRVTFLCSMRLYLNDNNYPGEPECHILRSI
jgi:hypothetical protein